MTPQWQRSTYVNVVVTNVQPVMKNGQVVALRGFMKVYSREGQYQFGRSFFCRENIEAAIEAFKGRLLVKPNGERAEKPEARLSVVSGYMKDRNKGSVWFNNFEIVEFEAATALFDIEAETVEVEAEAVLF